MCTRRGLGILNGLEPPRSADVGEAQTIVTMIGTTRSRVSFFMNRFRELGFIEYGDGGMHVHSSPVSVVLHD